MGFKSGSGTASAANQTTIIGHIDGIETLLAAIQTAVEIIDNFISGARGLVTEDNSAAALTALQTIDNFISGARGLVTEDNSAAILTALQIIDDWDETNRAAVNLIASQAGITGGAGAVGASTPRVTLASDDSAVVALQIIDNFISGSRGLVTEDSSAASLTALQVIDNFISGSRGLVTEDSAAAILTAVQIMDDWDETNRAAVNLIASQAGITGGAGAVGASSPRVTLASDDPAVVDLAAIEVLLTTIDAVLDTIKVDTEAIETAVELIDNASVDHGAAAVAGVTQVGFEGEDYGTTPGLVNDNDATRPLADTQGIQFVIGGAPHLITREIAHGTDGASDENMAGAVVAAAEV